MGCWRRKPPEYYKNEEMKQYLDPRVLANSEERYDISCDIWSLGMLVYRLITGSFPKVDHKVNVGANYEYLSYNSGNCISPMLNYLCSRCLFKNPHYRILPENVKYQPFFISVNNDMKGYVLSLIHICRCRRYAVCRSRWSPYH
eukprot:TRINITY_DN692_c0_g1_i1.p1 TRINITY_DN692_c0_g1~~TRINITY_DN692_c0_g1_i1.p1  ORF type:complete len:144 (+),score=39.71 TRINITY_DN692_c0_g1_i1:1284-1715(+)